MGRDDVFVRSLASRGSHGAIAGATRNVARLLELSGSFDVILIETVGAGQTEVAIAELADTVALVTVPGLGDAVQAIKAGLMEVADMVVVNMADRPGTPETVRHLRLTLGRDLPVATTIATEGTGVEELRALFDERWAGLSGNGAVPALRDRKRAREAALIAEAWTARLRGRDRAEPGPEHRGQGDPGGGGATMDDVETEPALDVRALARGAPRARLRARPPAAGAAGDAVRHPDRRRLHAGGRRGHRPRARHRAPGRVPVHARARTRACTAAGRGRSARWRGSARPRTPTAASSTCSPTARPGSRPTSTCRRCSATTPTTRSTGARSARSASPSTPSSTCTRCSTASRSRTSRPR